MLLFAALVFWLLRVALEEMHAEDPDFVALLFELFTMSRHNPELAERFREILERTREHVAAVIGAKHAEGVIEIHAPAEAIVDVIFAIGDGLALRMLAEPDRDFSEAIGAAAEASPIRPSASAARPRFSRSTPRRSSASAPCASRMPRSASASCAY